jgi:sugar phosphate isomerase/epimerase
MRIIYLMIKLALFTVTYCGLWYRGEALPLKDQILKAKELGFEGISVETKRPVALPCDLSRKERVEIKEFADSHGITICAVETMSNFVKPLIEDRENNLCMVREAIELANDLEAGIVKVFAAWLGTSRYDGLGTYDFGRRIFDLEGNFVTDLQRWRWAVEGIRDAARWAAEYGITIALQNHPPVIRPGFEDALQMVKEVNMENVKLCLDVPLFEDQSDEYIHEAVEACKDVGIVHSHYGSLRFDESPSGEIIMRCPDSRCVNYPAFIRELKRIGFDGFIASEECSPVLKNHEYQGIEAVDRHVKAALKYMRNLILTGEEPRVIKVS